MVSFLQGVYDTMTPRSQRNRNPQRIESDSSDDEAEAAGKKGARFFKVDERERESYQILVEFVWNLVTKTD